MNNQFLLFYSPKPRSHVRILIYRKWPIERFYSLTNDFIFFCFSLFAFLFVVVFVVVVVVCRC